MYATKKESILILTRRPLYAEELVINIKVNVSMPKPVVCLHCPALCCKYIFLYEHPIISQMTEMGECLL